MEYPDCFDHADHMLFFDSVGYVRVEDDYGYSNYIRFLSFGNNLGDATTIFLVYNIKMYIKMHILRTYRECRYSNCKPFHFTESFLFLQHNCNTIHQLAASEYLLGDGFTDEVHSALNSVFRFLN